MATNLLTWLIVLLIIAGVFFFMRWIDSGGHQIWAGIMAVCAAMLLYYYTDRKKHTN